MEILVFSATFVTGAALIFAGVWLRKARRAAHAVHVVGAGPPEQLREAILQALCDSSVRWRRAAATYRAVAAAAAVAWFAAGVLRMSAGQWGWFAVDVVMMTLLVFYASAAGQESRTAAAFATSASQALHPTEGE
jgi:hypothetical protein